MANFWRVEKVTESEFSSGIPQSSEDRGPLLPTTRLFCRLAVVSPEALVCRRSKRSQLAIRSTRQRPFPDPTTSSCGNGVAWLSPRQ